MAKMNISKPDTILMVLLGITLGLQFFASIIDVVTNATDTVAGKSIPLASLFSSDGVIMLLIVASFILLLVKTTRSGK